MRPFFGIKADRIRLDQNIIFLSFDFVFVNFAFAEAGNKNVPHPAGRIFAHHAGAAVPVIKVSDHRNPFGVGCPDGKADAFYTVLFTNVGAELFIHLKVVSFAQQVDVNIAQRRLKTIGVFRFINFAAVIFDFETIRKIFSDAEIDLKETALIKTIHHPAGISLPIQHFNRPGMGLPGADKHIFASFVAVNAEHGKNIVMIAFDHGVHFGVR